MTPHRRDPYLWLHLAGLATVPLWLDVCLVGLAVGEPIVPPWLELATLTLVGTLPIILMQLGRPFYIFSVPGLALRPDKLSVERRRLLTLQRGGLSRGLILLTAIALWYALYWLYQIAPVVADVPWLTGKSRATGWGICGIAFFFANLFALVPATILPLLLTSSQRLARVTPIEATSILSKFMVLGLRLSKVLPEDIQLESLVPESTAESSTLVGANVAAQSSLSRTDNEVGEDKLSVVEVAESSTSSVDEPFETVQRLAQIEEHRPELESVVDATTHTLTTEAAAESDAENIESTLPPTIATQPDVATAGLESTSSLATSGAGSVLETDIGDDSHVFGTEAQASPQAADALSSVSALKCPHEPQDSNYGMLSPTDHPTTAKAQGVTVPRTDAASDEVEVHVEDDSEPDPALVDISDESEQTPRLRSAQSRMV